MSHAKSVHMASHSCNAVHVAFQEGEVPDVNKLCQLATVAISAARETLVSIADSDSLMSACGGEYSGSQSQSQNYSLSTSLRSDTVRGGASFSCDGSLSKGQHKQALAGGWYSAKWRCICTCALPLVGGAQFSPLSAPPPRDLELFQQTPPRRCELPQVGDLLRDWDEAISPPEDGIEDLADFDCTWNRPDKQPVPSTSLAQVLLARKSTNIYAGARKGKGRATDPAELGLVASVAAEPRVAPSVRDILSETAGSGLEIAALARKKRRKERQDQVESDTTFGRLLDVLPLPHTSSPPPSLTERQIPVTRSKVPDFDLPRSSGLLQMIASQPYTRVYWLIPVHGVVNLTSPGEANEAEPTAALHLARRPPKSSKKPEIIWTPHRLRQFWTEILHGVLQQSGNFGPIGLAASGPKPDPFRPENEGVAVETGDHIRVYCDLEWALKVRKYLEHVRIHDGVVEDGQAGLRGERLFKKAVLVLVGDKHEVLLVA